MQNTSIYPFASAYNYIGNRTAIGSLEGTLAISIVSRRKQRPGTCWNFFGILSAGLINCLFRFARFHSRFRGVLSSCSSTSRARAESPARSAREKNESAQTVPTSVLFACSSFFFFFFFFFFSVLQISSSYFSGADRWIFATADFRRSRNNVLLVINARFSRLEGKVQSNRTIFGKYLRATWTFSY